MTTAPQTRYARSGDTHIAYQVVGDGEHDVVLHLPFRFPMDQLWEIPQVVATLERIATYGRIALFDRRGTGESDPVDGPMSIEDWLDDTAAVMRDAGMERAWMCGIGIGGAVAILHAATHPDRTSGLVLLSAVPRTRPGPGYPWGIDDPDEWTERFRSLWGSGDGSSWRLPMTPEIEADLHRWVARGERHTTSPRGLRALLESYTQIDVTNVLDAIHVPTLVVGYHGDLANDWAISEYLAERIRGAELHESPSLQFYAFAPDREEVLARMESFVTGIAPAVPTDRVLATLLFTDIVESTRLASNVGDAAWRSVLERHDEATNDLIRRYGGRRVKHTGDGVLATFDGPARAIRCAQAIADAVSRFDIAVRAGIHTGEIERRGDDILGIAVHIGQRVSSLAGPGEVLVSRTVTDLVAGSGLRFEERGEHELKGVPGTWNVFALVPESSSSP